MLSLDASMKRRLPIGALAVALAAGAAYGHDAANGAAQDAAHGAGHQGAAHEGSAPAIGHPGDPAKAARTIDVTMTDAMRFSPAVLVVKRGETVRIVARNEGRLEHELVLGTDEDLREHAEAMRKSSEMAHAEPNMLRVKPGGKAELTWTFDQAGRVPFACLIPGHFEAGMKGEVDVR